MYNHDCDESVTATRRNRHLNDLDPWITTDVSDKNSCLTSIDGKADRWSPASRGTPTLFEAWPTSHRIATHTHTHYMRGMQGIHDTCYATHMLYHSFTSHYNLSHHATPRHITSHHITSHNITSHHTTPHHITSHHITSHHITSHDNAETD